MFVLSSFYNRQNGHGYGTPIDGYATAEEAYKASGMDWEVQKVQAEYRGQPVPGYFWTVRADTGKVLGSVRSGYEVTQNKELFDFLAPVIGEDAVYDTAGVLYGGRVVWAQADLPKSRYVIPGDPSDVRTRLLVTTSHDYRIPYMAAVVHDRTICANTWKANIGDAICSISIRHTRNVHELIAQAHKAMIMAVQNSEKMTELMIALAATKLHGPQVEAFIKHLFPSHREDNGDNPHWRTEQMRELAMRYMSDEINNPRQLAWTAYSAFNGITGLVDHAYPVRKGTDRQYSAWFGRGDEMKVKALDWLVENTL